tara:strand:+ start:1631 stop:3271 length:1641 start_codon:yes stop_codon:yes gene_type:complete
MEAVLPKNINYLDTLPKAVPAEKKRKNFFPANGQTFVAGQTVIIEISDPRHFLDASNSFLRFTAQMNGALNFSPDYGGGYSFIRNFRVQQAGNTIMDIQRYNRLYNAIIAPTTGGEGWLNTHSLTNQSGAATRTGAAAANAFALQADMDGGVLKLTQCNPIVNPILLGNGATADFCVPLFGGLFSQNKLIPLPLLNQPIQLIFDIEADENVGVWSAAPGGVATLSVSNFRYCAELVDVPRDIIGYLRSVQDLHGGSLVMPGSSYEHQQATLDDMASAAANGGFVGEKIVPIPSRKRSIKSVQFCCMSDASSIAPIAAIAASGIPGSGTHSVYNLSCSKNPYIVNYQLKAGSHVMPPTAINGPGGRQALVAGALGGGGAAPVVGLPDREQNRGEACMEVAKAVGHLGTTIGLGQCCSMTFMTDAENVGTDWVVGQGMAGAGGDVIATSNGLIDAGNIERSQWSFSPFAIDLEAYQKEALNAGFDTKELSLQMNLILNINNTRSSLGGGAGFPDVTNVGLVHNVLVDTYTYYDVMYYINRDGTITYSD